MSDPSTGIYQVTLVSELTQGLVARSWNAAEFWNCFGGSPKTFILEDRLRGCQSGGRTFQDPGQEFVSTAVVVAKLWPRFQVPKRIEYIHAMASRGRHDSSLMVLVETLLLVCPLRDRKTDCIHNGVVMLVNVCMVWVLWQSRNCRIATRVRQAPIDGDFGRDHSSRLSISGQEN